MHSSTVPLTADDIDDLLYFTRANEVAELEAALASLAQKFSVPPASILAAAIDPDSGNTVLHYCSANGLSTLLSTLLSYMRPPPSTTPSTPSSSPAPLSIDRPNAQGNTPLHWAALNGHLPVVKLLVGAGADVWAKNAAGHLAMFEAERAEKSEVVQFLLEAGGAEVETGAREGQASAEDVAEVQAGQQAEEAGSSSNTGSSSKRAEGGSGVEVDVDGGAKTNG